jgi:hypothetical protein
VFEVGFVGDAMLALARMPAPPGVAHGPCPAPPHLALDPLPDGCPAWARHGFSREGAALLGVGFAEGIRSPALAASTARNRALEQASLARAVRVAAGAHGTPAPRPPLAILEAETARCGDAVVARVRARVSE